MVSVCLGLTFALVYHKDPFLDLCCFYIYINDLSSDIKSKCKLFAGETSLFSAVHDIDTSANDLNHDLQKISEWAFQSKMNFNADTSKQA